METELLPGLEKWDGAVRMNAFEAVKFHAVELLANILNIVENAASIPVSLSRSVILLPPRFECLYEVNLCLLDLRFDLFDHAPLLGVLVELLSVAFFFSRSFFWASH